MSSVADSPLHSSSSSEDFAIFLDSHLDCASLPSNSESDGESELASGDTSSEPQMKRIKLSSEAADEFTDSVPEASSSGNACPHPGSFGGMCISCGEKMEDELGVTFTYVHKELRLAKDEIVRLRNKDMNALRSLKKLYLVLDLDHTLLNSTHIRDMAPEEEYLKGQANSPDGSLFLLEGMAMMTKLRPFVRSFLEEANKMFELYIYTMGERAYANEMANLLDPKKEYFSGRVISRDDGTGKHEKRLDIVLGQESAVLILDDTEPAWLKHRENLIIIERYHFFSSSCRQFNLAHKSLSERKEDEREEDGSLASVLDVLKRVHCKFFDDSEAKDVREVLKDVKKGVLKGCKVVFSHVIPTEMRADSHPLWRMAEDLGAECACDVDMSVTHVVSKHCGTEKSKWALKNGKFVVGTAWIEAASYLWQKQPEDKFPLVQ